MVFVPPATPELDRELELINRLRGLYTIARDHRRSRHENWYRNWRLLNNLYNSQQGGQSWQPAPRDSEIYPTVSAWVGWITDQSIVLDMTPAADPGSQWYPFVSQVAADLGNLLYSNYHVGHFDEELAIALWDHATCGVGLLKSVWDNNLMDGMGDAVMKRVDPWDLYVDPSAKNLDGADYIIETSRVGYDELCRRYPEASVLIEASDAGGDPEQSDRPERPLGDNRTLKANPGALPGGQARWNYPQRGRRSMQSRGFVVYEFWLKDNEEWYEEEEDPNTLSERHIQARWRVVTVCNNVVLMDEWADELYANGLHPYSRICLEDIGEFYGIALIDHLAYPQLYLNRLLTAAQQNTELTGNPVFLEPTNSGLSRVGIVNRPGQRLPVNGAAMVNQGSKPQWLQPPPMPSMVMDLVNFWISRIENTSGLSAMVKGATPTSRSSEGTMTVVQEAAFVRIRAAIRALERALESALGKVADLIISEYSTPRIIGIIGPSGEQTPLLLAARHFDIPTAEGAQPLKYMLNVQAGSSTPTSRQARVGEADKLFAMGALDRQGLLEAHQYPRVADILKRIKQGMQDGTFNPPGARQRSQRKG